ncbi:hypothetical protein MO973_46030 [Paenibacillus sp. TRM 82003]|nr:hypothetical protein [Paenibacillus sp. TRM 82003]
MLLGEQAEHARVGPPAGDGGIGAGAHQPAPRAHAQAGEHPHRGVVARVDAGAAAAAAS